MARPATTKPAATEMTGRRNAASLARFRWLILMSLGGAGHHQANSVTVDGLAFDDADDPGGKGWAVVGGENEVIGDRMLENDAHPMAVGRDVAHAKQDDVMRRFGRDVAAVEADASRPRLSQPDDGLHELVLTVSFDASDANDLAGADLKVETVHGTLAAIVFHHQLAHLEHRGCGACWALVNHEHHGA